MKIGLVSDCLAGRSFEELLKTCKELGIEQVELGVGNWSSAPHVDLDALLESETRRDEMKGMLRPLTARAIRLRPATGASARMKSLANASA